jgi:hypothetical protein
MPHGLLEIFATAALICAMAAARPWQAQRIRMTKRAHLR